MSTVRLTRKAQKALDGIMDKMKPLFDDSPLEGEKLEEAVTVTKTAMVERALVFYLKKVWGVEL